MKLVIFAVACLVVVEAGTLTDKERKRRNVDLHIEVNGIPEGTEAVNTRWISPNFAHNNNNRNVGLVGRVGSQNHNNNNPQTNNNPHNHNNQQPRNRVGIPGKPNRRRRDTWEQLDETNRPSEAKLNGPHSLGRKRRNIDREELLNDPAIAERLTAEKRGRVPE